MNGVHQIGFGERLVEKVGKSQLVEFPPHILLFICGERHHRSFGEAGETPKALNGLGAIHDRHIDIHEDQIRPAVFRHFQPYPAIVGDKEFILFFEKNLRNQVLDIIVVIDQ